MISLAKKRYILPNLDFTLGDILEFEYRASGLYYIILCGFSSLDQAIDRS